MWMSILYSLFLPHSLMLVCVGNEQHYCSTVHLSFDFPPVSPLSLRPSQIEGAFMQGLGLYTLEELKFSPSGLLYTRGPSQYKIPAVCDMPLQFNVYLLSDSHNPHAIYSSKVRGRHVHMYRFILSGPSSFLFIFSSLFYPFKYLSFTCQIQMKLWLLQSPQQLTYQWYFGSAGYWRTCPLPGQLSVLRHQRRCGCCSLRVWSSRPIFPGQSSNTRESLSGLCLQVHSEGNNMRRLMFWLRKCSGNHIFVDSLYIFKVSVFLPKYYFVKEETLQSTEIKLRNSEFWAFKALKSMPGKIKWANLNKMNKRNRSNNLLQ